MTLLLQKPFLTKEQMEKLSTRRLLAYKDKMMEYHDTPNWDGDAGLNKTSTSWIEAYENIKSVLSTRENIER